MKQVYRVTIGTATPSVIYLSAVSCEEAARKGTKKALQIYDHDSAMVTKVELLGELEQ